MPVSAIDPQVGVEVREHVDGERLSVGYLKRPGQSSICTYEGQCRLDGRTHVQLVVLDARY